VLMHEWGTDRGECLLQVQHIRRHLGHKYSIAVNQVMVATVKLSKWWLQRNQEEPLRSTRILWLMHSSHLMSFLLRTTKYQASNLQKPVWVCINKVKADIQTRVAPIYCFWIVFADGWGWWLWELPRSPIFFSFIVWHGNSILFKPYTVFLLHV